jgi:hypothetical protein
MRSMIRLMMYLLVIGTVSTGLAASPAIGFATAGGNFLVNHSRVSGNTSLFDGTVMETREAGSLLELYGGTHLELGPSSQGRVYRDRMVLERGWGRMISGNQYRLEAHSLQIVPAASGATAEVSLTDTNHVRVGTLSGTIKVISPGGVLLALLESGKRLDFEPQAGGASAPFTVTGCLEKSEGRYLLKDVTASITFELKGRELEREAGSGVKIIGTDIAGAKPISGASRVIQVNRLTRVSDSCSSSPSQEAKASTGRKVGKDADTRMSGTTKAIIAGVAIAAAGTSAAVGLIGEEEEPAISR